MSSGVSWKYELEALDLAGLGLAGLGLAGLGHLL